MNDLVRVLGLLLPFVLSACATTAGVSMIGIDASDEELLATLASLARRGTEAICNPVVLEKELNIKIGEIKIERPGAEGGDYIDHQQAIGIAPVRDTGQVKNGGFMRFRSAVTSRCHIYVQFSTRRLCKRDSIQVASIMGVPLVLGPESPHGPQHNAVMFVYEATGKKTTVGLGDNGQACANGFGISSEGNWK